MKTLKDLGRYLTRSLLAAALAGLAWLPATALAQTKGAEQLMKLQRLDTPADLGKVAAGDVIVMSCPKCKDSWATVVRPTGKAVHPKDTKTVRRHECPGCRTTLATQGTGKQAKDVVKHVCTHCGSGEAYCCVLKQADAPAGGTMAPKEHQH